MTLKKINIQDFNSALSQTPFVYTQKNNISIITLGLGEKLEDEMEVYCIVKEEEACVQFIGACSLFSGCTDKEVAELTLACNRYNVDNALVSSFVHDNDVFASRSFVINEEVSESYITEDLINESVTAIHYFFDFFYRITHKEEIQAANKAPKIPCVQKEPSTYVPEHLQYVIKHDEKKHTTVFMDYEAKDYVSPNLDTSVDTIQKGMLAIAEDEYAKGLDYLSQILCLFIDLEKIEPLEMHYKFTTAQLYYYIGLAFEKLEDAENTVNYFNQAYIRGCALDEIHALGDNKKLIHAASDHLREYFETHDLLVPAIDYTEHGLSALASLEEYDSDYVDEHFPNTLAILGRLYTKKGDTAEAEKYFAQEKEIREINFCLKHGGPKEFYTT